jgi:taurine dioxygenase
MVDVAVPSSRRLFEIYPARGARRMALSPEGWVSLPYENLRLSALARTIGAEVEGIDLSLPLTAALFDEVNRALLEWKVLVFRHQAISPTEQADFVAHWGELFDDSLVATPDAYVAPFVVEAPATANQNYWHADDTFMARPGLATALRITELPPLGGDTVFSDMAVAYDNLDPDLRAQIDNLVAVHDCASYAAESAHYLPRLDEITARFPPVEHPVVRTHPETGRRTLFVNAVWTQCVVGLSPAESDALLLHLCTQATVPEYQCRVRWTTDTLVLWDNRAVQHYAVGDYTEARTMVRATVRGDRPV